MEKFDTHKFMYTLFHEGRVKGHTVEFIDRDNNLKKIELDSIEIGASPVTCKLYDINKKRYIVPFIKIRQVFFEKELVWDSTETDISNVKVIKGYK